MTEGKVLYRDIGYLRECELPYFGGKVYGWATADYSPVKGWGDLPFQRSRFGILLLKRVRTG
jgi:hypothetical protein